MKTLIALFLAFTPGLVVAAATATFAVTVTILPAVPPGYQRVSGVIYNATPTVTQSYNVTTGIATVTETY